MFSLSLTSFRILFLTLAFASGLLLAHPAAAQVTVTDGDLEATFSSTPLFNAPNTADIAPSAVQTGMITVENTGSETESVLLAAVSTSSTGLAEAVELRVSEGATLRYAGTFANFFATSSVALSDLAPGVSTSYTLTATFLSSSGNQYQGTTMGFDLRIGFASGAGVTSPPGGTGGGGGDGTTGTLVRPPTPGSSNTDTDPDGVVAGATDSNGLADANQPWPWWDTVTTAIRDTLTPERSVGTATVAGTTTTEAGETEAAGAEDIIATSSVAGATDENSTNQQFCILLWFLLLALLGLLARYFGMPPAQAPARDWALLRTMYLALTIGYLLGLYMVTLLTTITPIWGWVLFAAWIAYQGYDYSKVWQKTAFFSRVRTVVLLAGVLLLFVLPSYVSWLCAWW